ncbi:AroB-related putative sugar phosphate phospholyase (cyclizing) [Effusibacillus consociatus]|uniref:AroB-related putative sugar phosphate phospholyase (Cyclizing) n=1 Tax=Effusibacillus consociatus TaxID=1117041 RepID=A0ABV9PYB1_9BACL
MSLGELSLSSKIRDYKVYFTETTDFLLKLQDLPNCVYVADSRVWDHHADGCLSQLKSRDVIVLSIDEERKNLETVQDLYEQIIQRSPRRSTTIVSIGGGITQDITGFAASTVYRGVNWVFVPTTLLAQADSCIGSKTSLNFKHYKNWIGTFYPPSEVYIYSPFLKTLDPLDFFSGLGEVAKLHLMGGEQRTKELIAQLPAILQQDDKALLEAVHQSLLIKQSYVEGDEFDTGRRNLLNFGHCFGHAIESATDFAVSHGQAVVLGMLLANVVSKKRGILSSRQERFLAENALLPILKVNVQDLMLDQNKIIEAMKQDKKRKGAELALVMITDSYELLKVDDLIEAEVSEALSQFFETVR